MTTTDSTGPFIIAGGSGFLGTSLATHLTRAGHEVVVLTRSERPSSGPWTTVWWDARTPGDWCNVLDGARGLVNFVGRSVDCIKSPDQQDEILRSRVEATRALGLGVRAARTPPPVWVQMSTAHIYGDPPQIVCSEESPCGYGFAPFVGRAWEEEFHHSVLPAQRSVILRTSFVIGRNRGSGEGAMSRLRMIVRLGLGGRVGSGTQGMSWIHEIDLNRLIELALSSARMQGIYVASAPNPVPQAQFMAELRRAMKMPIGLPASAWMVRLGAKWLLRTDPELALYGRYVVSRRLQDERFEFCFPRIREALADLLN